LWEVFLPAVFVWIEKNHPFLIQLKTRDKVHQQQFLMNGVYHWQVPEVE